MANFTCITCSVKFRDGDTQRDHYKSDWHRLNLKRKVVNAPAISAEDFNKTAHLLRAKNEQDMEDRETRLFCKPCRKHFNLENSLQNHLQSKKHKDNVDKMYPDGEVKEITSRSKRHTKEDPIVDEEDDIEEIDSDEWEDVGPNPISDNNCIFCEHHSEDIVSNLKHMSIAHSFFIPDAEYCIDVDGLLFYLGDKVFNHFICLWCNDRGKTFHTLDAVQKHMRDKGHCQMLHEGIALAEYTEYYDYSTSYPDNEEDMDIDEEVVPELLDCDDYQLVLPSGAIIGHRSLLRYYKQRLNPNRQLKVRKKDKKLHKVLAEYRSLGWTNTQQEAAARKARDIHLMKRVQAKWQMKLGVKANKLQRHFRQQVLF